MTQLQFTLGYAFALLRFWVSVNVIVHVAREVRMEYRRARGLLTQKSYGRHSKQALAPTEMAAKRGSHRGQYRLMPDLKHSLSGHGIGWGVHTAL